MAPIVLVRHIRGTVSPCNGSTLFDLTKTRDMSHPPPADPHQIPAYWSQAGQDLSRADPILGQIIARYPGESLMGRGDALHTLANAIVGQQISTASAAAIFGRIKAAHPMDAAHLATVEAGALHACGLTRRKTAYLQGVAQVLLDGALKPTAWPEMDDAAVMAQVQALRGIGPWTAQMLLIFHLLRPDVLPTGDIGLLRALDRHYGGRERLADISDGWRPWRTVATWYLWRSLDPTSITY